MVRIRFRKRCESSTVEIDPVIVDEVRILARIHSASGKPDLTRGLIDLFHTANHPVTFRDLILYASGDAVVEIEVIPAIPLGHPDHFPAVIDVAAKLLA